MTSLDKRNVILEYYKYLIPPKAYWSDHYFIERSCEIWVLKEILSRFETNKSDEPAIIIQKFINDMDNFSELNNNSRMLFVMARELSMDILNLIR